MWRVYTCTRKDEDYTNYKEALNAAMAEIRKSRSCEQKLACNIENDSKSFYAYFRSKQNVRDKVRTLEDSARNIISQGFLMVEDLNRYFSSVFTRRILGSILGPLLFLIYINDFNITCNILTFAGDKVFRKVKNYGYKQHLQNDLDKLVKWSKKMADVIKFSEM